MRQAQHLAVEFAGRRDVLDAARDLADRAESDVATHIACPPEQSTVAPYPVPLAEVAAAGETEFRKSIGDVIFDGVQGHTLPPRDLRIAHPMPHRLRHPPFGGRQHVGMRRPAALFPL